jgi:ribonucleoside-diphosphate reductase beta chain
VIFEEQLARKPDHYPWTEEFVRAMWEGHWTDREFNFCSDIHDFRTNLTEQEQEIIVRCLSAIAQIEVAVKTFWAKLGDNLPHPSIRDMGYVMANVECYAEGTEVLTPSGWCNLFDVKNGDPIYQYHPEDGSLSETKAKDSFSKPYKGAMFIFGSKSNKCMVTPNHNMLVRRIRSNSWELTKATAKDLKIHPSIKMPKTTYISSEKKTVNKLSYMDRLAIAIQADGTRAMGYSRRGEYVERGSTGGYTYQLRFRRARKIERIEYLISNAGIDYKKYTLKDGVTQVFNVVFPTDNDYKNFSWVDLSNKSTDWCKEFVEELFHWDGSLRQRAYFSKYKENVDFCQHVGILAGYHTTVGFTDDYRTGQNRRKHRVLFAKKPSLWRHISDMRKEEVDYFGRVGCVTVDTGAIMTRLDGRTFIAGNCIHNSAYERLLEVLGIEDVFEKNLQLEWMQGRVKYLRKYTHRFYKDSKKQFIYALILFTLFVENVSLFSQFYVINWFGRKNLLKDTNQQTNYTLKEEDLHAKAGIKLIQVIRSEHPELFDDELQGRILDEAREAFKAESKIIDWMVNGIKDELLSAELLKEFVKNRINSSLSQIGFDSVFDVDQDILAKTLWFDEESLGNGMTDFFHARPVEYSKKGQSFSEEDLF